MKTGDYIKRRSGGGREARAVVLEVRDGTIDALTFYGLRSIEPIDAIERMWEVAGDGSAAAVSWELRMLPLGPGHGANALTWTTTNEIRLEVWPWNDLAETMANLARVGLRCGRLLSVKPYGPPGDRVQLQTFAVEGTYREPTTWPARDATFPPFAETDAGTVVSGGATGIRVDKDSEPVTLARMEVTGPGSVGIDLD